MIFPIIRAPAFVQTEEKIRFSAIDTFASIDEPPITDVEISIDLQTTWISVFNADSTRWFLDWSYAPNELGPQIDIRCRATNTNGTVTSGPIIVTVLSPGQDALFSTDADLEAIEPDIRKWVPPQYSTWNFMHRESQTRILEWFDEIRLFKLDGTAWTKADVVNKQQVRKISAYMTLVRIFNYLSNQVDDVFKAKALKYEAELSKAMNRNYISLDFDGSGEIESNEKQELRSFTLVRR